MTAQESLCNNIPQEGNVFCLEFAEGKEPVRKHVPANIVRKYAEDNSVYWSPGENAKLGFTFVIKMNGVIFMPKTDLLIYAKGDAYVRKNGTNRRAPEYDLKNRTS